MSFIFKKSKSAHSVQVWWKTELQGSQRQLSAQWSSNRSTGRCLRFFINLYLLFLRLDFGPLNSLSPMLWVLSRFVFNSNNDLLNNHNWEDQKFCIHFFPLISPNISKCQTVVDELSVATIVLENNPWHDDISQSLECKILSFQLACYIISLRLWIQCLWELSEPAKGILPGVCLWIWPALLSIWHTGKFDK